LNGLKTGTPTNPLIQKMFNKLFGRKKLNKQVDISGLTCDMHSHLLPGIDDGVPDMITAIELIKEMKSLGYKKLITTPHIMSDVYKNTPEIIKGKLELLSNTLIVEGIDIQIQAAGEYQIDDGFPSLLEKGDLLTFGDNHILIELPYYHAPPILYEITFELQISGYKIILAHPERYQYWHHDFTKYHEMKDRGIFFQMNMMSISGHYSPEVKKVAEKMIDQGLIDFLGSDLHNFQYLQYIRKSLYEPYLEKLVQSGKLKNHTL
jgi:protein-tyrosine phosphatase